MLRQLGSNFPLLVDRSRTTLRRMTCYVGSTSFSQHNISDAILPVTFYVKRWKSTSKNILPGESNTSSESGDDDGKTTKKIKSKRKRPDLRRKPLSVMSQKTARDLYDKMAPHLTRKVIRDICTLLNKKAAKNGTNKTKYVNIVRNLWKDEMSKEDLPPLWARQELKLTLFDRGEYHSLIGSKKRKAGYAPQLNRKNSENNISLLMKARDASVNSKLLWTQTQRQNLKDESLSSTSASQVVEEIENDKRRNYAMTEILDNIMSERRSLHEGKCEVVLREEAEVIFNHLADKLPSDIFQDLMELLGRIGSTSSDRIKFLLPSLHKCVKSHLHLVVFEIAEFMYIETMDTNYEDKRIKGALKKWDNLRERFARTLPVFQRKFLEKKKKTSARKQIEAEFIDIEIRGEEPTDELNQSGEEKAKLIKKRRQYHVQLEALMLTDIALSVENVEKMVLVDNLPIDISEMELFDLYSRCGPIQSISIFNQRADLDPGPLSSKQLKERRRKMRMNRISTLRTQHWQRPRTPVYAIITFATNEGSHFALDLHLKLFGMVVRKHDMRSLQVTDLKKLYVENIPQGIHCADLEYQLASHLKELDIYVCLDLGQPTKHEPTSCEIIFPSFEVAFLSRETVKKSIEALRESMKNIEEDERKVDEPHGIAVHWMRTPPNAMKYWTREIGFD